MQKLLIDKDFKKIMPPLTEKEFEALKDSIVAEGCQERIVTWKNFILDGHNRYKICKKYKIPFETKKVLFQTKQDATLWIIKNLKKTRNLGTIERLKLILKLDKIIKKRK